MKQLRRTRNLRRLETKKIGDSVITTMRSDRAQKKIVAHKFFLRQAKAVQHTKDQHERFLDKKRKQQAKQVDEVAGQIQTTIAIIQQIGHDKEQKLEQTLLEHTMQVVSER